MSNTHLAFHPSYFGNSRLQDEYVQLQSELRNSIEESKLVQEKYKAMLEHEKQEKSVLQTNIDDLKTQIVTPQRLEVIKLQVSEEIDKQYRDRFMKLDSEVEHHRTEYNKLRYEYSFLKSEYEHEKQENHRILEELKLQNEAEVSTYIGTHIATELMFIIQTF